MSKSEKKSTSFPKSWFLNAGIKGQNIGILTPGYGLEKVSYGLAPKGYYYKKVNRLPFQKIIKTDTVLTQCPVILSTGIDLVHSFNMLPLNKDFVLTFENELPRFFGDGQEKYFPFGLDILQSDRCKGIYGLSDASKHAAATRMIEYGYPELAKKVDVFRGGLDIKDTEIEKTTSGPIKICFVGENLPRKGIEGTIKGLEKLYNGGMDIEFTIIGRINNKHLNNPDYFLNEASYYALIDGKKWITHHLEIPNYQVIDLFRQSHLMILPSIDESLGWVMIEAALCGAVRIGLNSFAIPELISHGEDGWLIDIELGANNRWKHLGKQTSEKNWTTTQELITDTIVKIMSDPEFSIERLIAMGKRAQTNMNRLYSADTARDKLSSIYASALNLKP